MQSARERTPSGRTPCQGGSGTRFTECQHTTTKPCTPNSKTKDQLTNSVGMYQYHSVGRQDSTPDSRTLLGERASVCVPSTFEGRRKGGKALDYGTGHSTMLVPNIFLDLASTILGHSSHALLPRDEDRVIIIHAFIMNSWVRRPLPAPTKHSKEKHPRHISPSAHRPTTP